MKVNLFIAAMKLLTPTCVRALIGFLLVIVLYLLTSLSDFIYAGPDCLDANPFISNTQ